MSGDDDPTGGLLPQPGMDPLALLALTTTSVLGEEAISRPGQISRRELVGLVRELRLMHDRMPAEAREALLARKRALVVRLDPGLYEDLADEGLPEAEIDIEATELLELAHGGHLDVSHRDLLEPRRPEPNSPAEVALVTMRRARFADAVAAVAALELDCAAYGGSFPDDFRAVIEEVARRVGGSEALVETRPGCWEADPIRHLARGADYDLERLTGY